MFSRLTPSQLINSTRSAFWIPGFAVASWGPFIPFIKSNLQLTEDHLGYLLMCGAIGAGTTLLFANQVIGRFGCRAPVRLCGVLLALCLVGVTLVDSVYALGFLLYLFGLNSECIAICANVNAAAVEKYLDRSLMSGFHGIYSLGNAAGVFLVASMLSAGLSFVGGHMLLTAACTSLLVLMYCCLIASRNMITDLHATESFLNELQVQRTLAQNTSNETHESNKGQASNESHENIDSPKHNAVENNKFSPQATFANTQAVTEPQTTAEQQARFEQKIKESLKENISAQKTTSEIVSKDAAHKQATYKSSLKDFFHPILLMLGFMCFVMFMTEGSMLDWTGVFLNQFRGVPMSEAGYGFAAFAIMMTLCRLTGDKVVTVFGRKRILTIGGVLVTLGICLAVMVPHPIVAIIGFGLVGMGASNIVPQSVSYAATVKSIPLHRSIFIVNAIGYIGGLFGPALIGFLAHRIGLDITFIVLSCGTAFVALAAYLKVRSGSISTIDN